jgi:hypothetical protein
MVKKLSCRGASTVDPLRTKESYHVRAPTTYDGGEAGVCGCTQLATGIVLGNERDSPQFFSTTQRLEKYPFRVLHGRGRGTMDVSGPCVG